MVSLSVYLSVCLSASNLRQFFPHVTYGRGSVLLWRRSDDTLRISGFVDDVIFSHKLIGCSTRRRRAEAVSLTHTQP